MVSKNVIIISAVILVIIIIGALLLLSANNKPIYTSSISTIATTTVASQQNLSANLTLPSGPYISPSQASSLLGSSGKYTAKEKDNKTAGYNGSYSNIWTTDYIISSGAQLYESIINSTNASKTYALTVQEINPNSTSYSTFNGMQYAYTLEPLSPPSQILHIIGLKGDYFVSLTIISSPNSISPTPSYFVETVANELP
jgi:hypothetical protein